VGGTGVPPAVSGVPPETVSQHGFVGIDQLRVFLPAPTKFGETPNLTRETRLQPAQKKTGTI
jgi:hypothetical protein